MGTFARAVDSMRYMQAQPDRDFAASANAPIPGMFNGRPTSSYGPPTGAGFRPRPTPLLTGLLSQYMNDSYTPADWRGMLNQPQQGPLQAAPFQANGQYGLLAQQLAGTAGPNMQIPQQPPTAQANGLLGGSRHGFRIPGVGGGK